MFLQIYDIDVENLPMFVYQLPPGATDVLVTDRVIFTVIHEQNSGEVSTCKIFIILLCGEVNNISKLAF